jgi:hypothetical protein
MVGVGASMLAALASRIAGAPSFHAALSAFFLCFAALKFCVAMESVHRLRALRAGRPDPRDAEQPQVNWPVVIYKFAACAVSVFASLYVLTVGAAKVDAIFGG